MNAWRAVAERQYGVVTRAQLRVALTDKQIDRLLGRDLERVHTGVFRVAGSYPSPRESHGNRLAWKRDRRRIARLEALGWRLLHVTWDDVTLHPRETIGRIREAVPLTRAVLGRG